MKQKFEQALKKVKATIKEHSIFQKNDRVLVCLSGGADSVFLLYVLLSIKEEYSLTIYAAHLNHSLRDEADMEEEFCKKLCKNLGIFLFTKKEDILKLSKKEKISTETAGRCARYKFFDEIKTNHSITKIATAHHCSDNAETILMHFIRGAGTKGMSGIDYIHDGIVRPLLDLEKKEILDALLERKIDFVTDKSNFDEVYTRNKIRLSLIPKIMEFNSNFINVVTKNATLFSEDDNFINQYAKNIFCDILKNDGFASGDFLGLHISLKRRLISMLYKKVSGIEANLSKDYIDDILSLCQNGKKVDLPNGFFATLENDILYIKKAKTFEKYSYAIFPDTPLYIDQIGKTVLVESITEKSKNTFSLPENAELRIRCRKNGDVFYPVGMSGKKSVSNLFTDKKIPKDERDILPILVCDEKIVNIGGMYRDRRFYEEESKNLYTLKIY